MTEKTYRIGYANLLRSQPFACTVEESLVQATASYPNVELIVRDNALSNERALANIQEFAAIPVDLAIIFHIDERYNQHLGDILRRQRIPIIALEIPVPLATYFGSDNDRAGLLAGEEAVRWVNAHWGGYVDKVLIITDSRLLERENRRLSKAAEILSLKTHFKLDNTLYIDGETNDEIAYERAKSVLNNWSHVSRIAIFGLNDEMALAGLHAARDLGREEHVIVVGHGASRMNDGFDRPDSRFLGSVAYYPERYGPEVLKLGLRILAGEKVPRENFMNHVCITRENLHLLHT